MGKQHKPYLDKFKKQVELPKLIELMNIKNETIILDKSQYREINNPSDLEIGNEILFKITMPDPNKFVPVVSEFKMATVTKVEQAMIEVTLRDDFKYDDEEEEQQVIEIMEGKYKGDGKFCIPPSDFVKLLLRNSSKNQEQGQGSNNSELNQRIKR